jgi:FAD/FMN-containing dehydrogenase
MLPPPALRGIFRTDARARAAYSEGAGIYRIVPRGVACPSDVADLKLLISWAAEHRVPLVARGAGSAMGGGNVGEGVVVDLAGFSHPLHIDQSSRVATTGSAVTLAGLNAVAATSGLRLPPDPSSGSWATLGGMVSTNAAGARSVRFGSVRRWVQGLTLITADAEQVALRRGSHPSVDSIKALNRFVKDVAPRLRAAAPLVSSRFPRVRKNSSGYAVDAYLASGDLLDLIIGAEGTLGIVTEIEWRLDPVPEYRAGMRVQLPSLDHLHTVVQAIDQHAPSALELLDRSFLDLVGQSHRAASGVGADVGALLLVEFERDQEEALRQTLALAYSAARPWAVSIDIAYAGDADRLWAIRHAASPILAGLPEDRRSLQVIEDACVPIERMGEYITCVRRMAAELELPVALFGHAGDGHIHVNLLPELARPGWQERVAALLEEVTQLVKRLGGTTSGEHGDGRLRAQALEQIYGAEIVGLFREIKLAFDPAGIFNPGIILPSGEPPISRLKVGPEAATIPEDIQRGLREIELTGGYARNRLELAGEEEVEGQGSRVQCSS